MTFVLPEFLPVMPEIFVLAMACLILVLDLFLTERTRIVSYRLAQATLLGAAILTLSLYSDQPRYTFGDSFVGDAMGDVLKVSMYVVTAGVFLFSRDYLKERGLFKGEYFVLGLFGLLGMMVLVSAHSFLTIYLGLELLGLSLYALVAFDRDSKVASEAAMKYFVLGALASGMLLYGISMLYGSTGTLNLLEVGRELAEGGSRDVVLVFGLVFIVVGIGFKLGAVPFHMWIPDVYHGAPTAVTLYLGSVPKLAAFALAMRLLVDGLGALQADWQGMLVILAFLSMALGNIVAIAQSNLKRMLAYSTISHVGFILLGVLAGTSAGYAAAMFYTIVYAFTAMGAFGLILLLSRAGFEADRLADFKGLNERNPWFAFIMLVIMFSMAGVPPTVGFYAKLAVLFAVIDVDMVWLAIAAVVFSIVGAFYYLRIIKLMYFDKPEDSEALQSGFDMRTVISMNGLAIVALGVYPSALMSLCVAAIG